MLHIAFGRGHFERGRRRQDRDALARVTVAGISQGAPAHRVHRMSSSSGSGVSFAHFTDDPETCA